LICLNIFAEFEFAGDDKFFQYLTTVLSTELSVFVNCHLGVST
jgi:hypothetical protein